MSSYHAVLDATGAASLSLWCVTSGKNSYASCPLSLYQYRHWNNKTHRMAMWGCSQRWHFQARERCLGWILSSDPQRNPHAGMLVFDLQTTELCLSHLACDLFLILPKQNNTSSHKDLPWSQRKWKNAGWGNAGIELHVVTASPLDCLE